MSITWATITGMRPRDRKRLHEDRSSSRTIPRQLLDLLEEHIPGFREEKYAFEIAWLLWCGVDPARKHRGYEGAFWMHTDEIRPLFGEVGNFLDANRRDKCRYFQVLRHLNGTQSPEDSYTNGYQPQPWMQKALDLVINSTEPVDYIDRSRRAQRVPRSPISSQDTHGHAVVRWKGVKVPALIPVSVKNLELLAIRWEQVLALRSDRREFESVLDGFGLKERGVQRALQQTKVLIAQAKGKRNPGMLPVRYVLHETGRLYAEGLNLQSCKREIRQAALTGCWDVDISTCHFTIMAQMARKFGLSCPSVEEYVARKKAYREQIARDLKVSVADAKRLINAVGYGARQSSSPRTAISQMIGPDKATAFFAHPLYLGLKDDIVRATKVILTEHPVKSDSLINLANRAIPRKTDKGEDVKPSSLMAHLLQGVEAAALEAAVRACSSKVLLLQHDGFTATEPVNPALLTAAVEAETGYHLNFEVEQIQMPLEGLGTPESLFNEKFKNPLEANIHAGLEPFWPISSGTIPLSPCSVPPVYPLPLPAVDVAF